MPLVLKVKFDTQFVSDKFKKREFVLVTEATSPYPQPIKFELTQDKCELIENFQIGDEIKVNYNLRGKEYVKDSETKYFNSIQAWRLEFVNKALSDNSDIGF